MTSDLGRHFVCAVEFPGAADKSPGRIYFTSSTTAGRTWFPKLNISTAHSSVEHAISRDHRQPGERCANCLDGHPQPRWAQRGDAFLTVRCGTRTTPPDSTNGGATWSSGSRISRLLSRPSTYIHSNSFSFPFGDYFGIGIDSQGRTQAVWGEGLNFRSPGSIWYIADFTRSISSTNFRVSRDSSLCME